MVKETNLFRELESIEEVSLLIDSMGEDINLSFTGDTMLFRKVWLLLRQAGYKPSCRPTATDKTGFSTFWYKDEAVTIWMTFASSICKQVKVGVRTVEEPIYEVQCGDGSPQNNVPSSLAELI